MPGGMFSPQAANDAGASHAVADAFIDGACIDSAGSAQEFDAMTKIVRR